MQAVWASDVLSTFTELAAIPSPPGRERGVADRVIAYLRGLGLEVVEDDAGERLGGTAGNLLARLEPTGGGGGVPIFLCAHLDTVLPEGAIEPVVAEGVVRNAAGTILGADNKASVAVMLEAARVLVSERRPHAGVELLFTIREEAGCEGAKAFDTSALVARAGFVYDVDGPIGRVVTAAPSQATIDVVFKGRAAHAGINPEDGRSAIAAAARAVADLRLGRLDEETTANVGTISGGTARNVVPDRCALVAEARSRDEAKLAALVQEMLDCFAFAASVSECELETRLEEKYRGYRLRPGSLPLDLATAALERAGYRPETVEVNGGADANVFNARGLPCANLANGMANIHSPDEEIAVADLEAMIGVTLELVDAARSLG